MMNKCYLCFYPTRVYSKHLYSDVATKKTCIKVKCKNKKIKENLYRK